MTTVTQCGACGATSIYATTVYCVKWTSSYYILDGGYCWSLSSIHATQESAEEEVANQKRTNPDAQYRVEAYALLP